MSFWTDALRVVGTIGAAALAATGVGIPLAVGIGAATTAVGNAAADAIEREEAKKRADAEAQAQKEAAARKLEEERIAAEKRTKEVQDALNQQLAHAALPGNVINACRTGQIDTIPALLQQMDDNQIRQLAYNPITVCQSAEAQQRVLGMLDAERLRRNIT